jgi:hypothetical protein
MLYVNTAQVFLDSGFTAAKTTFSWPFFSVAIALVSKATGLGLENAGYLLNALFMAGACALMVSCTSCKQSELAWWICLISLALPGLNEYRNELLREYGCWFFIMLSFWLALHWSERPRWLTALTLQASLAAAALFRPEALAMFPALIAWQVLDAPKTTRWQRLLMLGGPPIACSVALIALYLYGHLSTDDRLALELSRINTSRFDTKAEVLASGLIEYARGQARTILLWGSLALIPIKLIQKTGLFLIPLVFLACSGKAKETIQRYPLFAWGIAAQLLVLCIFVTDLQFLAGRYVGLILLFATPIIGTGLWLMTRSYPRWKWLMVAIAVTFMLANVISTGPGKAHFVEAGQWLSRNATEPLKVYVDSGRTAFHAGWQKAEPEKRNERTAIEQLVAEAKFDLFVLEHSRKDQPIEDWLAQAGLRIVKRFDHPNGDAIIIAAPIAAPEQTPKNAPPTTGRTKEK